MNQQSKRAIKSPVLDLRHKLEDDIAIQLKRYGFAGERWLPLGPAAHIQQDDQATIDHSRLKAALEQELRRMGVDPARATDRQRAEAAGLGHRGTEGIEIITSDAQPGWAPTRTSKRVAGQSQ